MMPAGTTATRDVVDGYHYSGDFLDVRDKIFRTKLSCVGSATLERVKAPAFECLSALTACSANDSDIDIVKTEGTFSSNTLRYMQTSGSSKPVVSTAHFNSINAKLDVFIDLCDVNENVVAGRTLTCRSCHKIGRAVAKSISLNNCAHVAGVDSLRAFIADARILGDVKCVIGEIWRSTIEGTLHSTDLSCRIFASKVNRIFIKRWLPPDIAPLVHAVQRGHLHIVPTNKKFLIHAGDLLNMETFCATINDEIEVSAETINITDTEVILDDIQLPYVCVANHVKEAFLYLQNQKQPVIEISASQIGEIVFAEAGGLVKLREGSTVAKIINGEASAFFNRK